MPLILSLQEGDPPEHYLRRVGPLRALYRSIFERADIVHAISSFLGEYAHRMGYAGTVRVIPNGVAVSHFGAAPDGAELAALRKKLSKRKGEVYLITVSRLVKKNAVDDCIRALAHLPSHFKLIVVGEGPLGQWLWHLAAKVGVLERVLFTGHLSHDELPLYLHLSDIFVRPSRSEGMGNVFIEAMAAGLPVIGTPVGGITDFLFDPDRTKLGKVTPTGLFCDVDDPASIARAAIRLVEDEALRERIVESGSAMVREKYDWDALARAMHERVLSVGTPRAER